MKRHLQTPVAQPAPTLMMSNEEEAILQDECNEAANVADAAAADVDRLTEVAEVAQDAVLVVDETPELGQVEQDLVSAVGDMAVAGTDADPAEVIGVPGQDNPEGLSVEGIASTLKSIWNAIITAIKNMWVGLKHWLTTYFSSLEQNKKHAEKLIERLKGMKGWLANDGSMLTSGITDIYRFNGSGFLAFLNTAEEEDAYFRKYVIEKTAKQHETVKKIGEELVQGYDKFDGDKTNNEIDSTVNAMAHDIVSYLHSLELEPGSNGGWSTKHAMGNVKVIAKDYNKQVIDGAQSMETKIALLSKLRLSVDVSTRFGNAGGLSVKQDITADKLLTMVQDRLTYIEELLKFKGDQFKALETQAEKVQQACDRMLARIKEDNKEGVATAKRLMPLVTAYGNWATQPTAGLFKAAARHNKFWLSLYEMATNNFQAPATA